VIWVAVVNEWLGFVRKDFTENLKNEILQSSLAWFTRLLIK